MNYILIGLSIVLIIVLLLCTYFYRAFQSKLLYYGNKCPDYWENTSNLNNTGSSGCYVSAKKINKGKCATTENVTTNYCMSTNTGATSFGSDSKRPIAGIYTELDAESSTGNVVSSGAMFDTSVSDNWDRWKLNTLTSPKHSGEGYKPETTTYWIHRNKAGFTYTELNKMSDCDKYEWANENAIAWNGVRNNHNLKKQCK